MLQNQVIILRVNYLPRQRTEVEFVVLKQAAQAPRIAAANILASTTVKSALQTQLRPLSRVLGGVHIERLQLASFERRSDRSQNYRLYVMLLMLMISLAICYTIACFKVIR